MQISTTAPIPTNEQMAIHAAGQRLDRAADLLGQPNSGRTEFHDALKNSTVASGLLKSYGSFGYGPAVQAALVAASELNTIAFSAIATAEGAPERFDRPSQGRIDAAVAAARTAAAALVVS